MSKVAASKQVKSNFTKIYAFCYLKMLRLCLTSVILKCNSLDNQTPFFQYKSAGS